MTSIPTATLTSHCYSLGHTDVLELDGDCDVATESLLRRTVVGALGQGPSALIVDLTHVRFCDAGSAAVLLAAGQRTPIVLVGANGIVARVFDILDAGQTLTREPSVAEAARHLVRD
jgi:anti-anti-sigma factor